MGIQCHTFQMKQNSQKNIKMTIGSNAMYCCQRTFTRRFHAVDYLWKENGDNQVCNKVAGGCTTKYTVQNRTSCCSAAHSAPSLPPVYLLIIIYSKRNT